MVGVTPKSFAARLYLKELTNLFALWPETFSRSMAIGPWGRWAQGTATLMIFAGVVIALSRVRGDPALWPLVGAVLTFALASAVFFTVMRYRMVIEPCLLWLAGVGWGSTAAGTALARRLGLGRAGGDA